MVFIHISLKYSGFFVLEYQGSQMAKIITMFKSIAIVKKLQQIIKGAVTRAIIVAKYD